MIRVSLEPPELVIDRPNEVIIRLTNVGRGTCTRVVLRLSLPTQVTLLEGPDRIEVPRLEEDQSVTRAVRLMPKVVGDWTLTSSNFSYVDAQGQSRRITDMRLGITVLTIPPAPIVPEPEFRVKLITTEVPLKEWGILQGQVINTGPTALRQLALRVFGPVTCDPNIPLQTFGPLGPGEAAKFEICLRANESGDSVPVHIEATYTDIANRTGRRRASTPLRVLAATTKPDSPPEFKKMDKKIKVLFLAANPVDLGRLRLDEELREIGKKIRAGSERDCFELVTEMALRPGDLTEALLRHKPHVVHFSGHGSKTNGIALEDELGKTKLVNKQALARIFKILKDDIRIVALNACYAKDQAEALAETIDFTIGMNDAIGDKAAIMFAAHFYQALAFGRSVREAFDLALAQLDLETIDGSNVPVLLVRPGADPTQPFVFGARTQNEATAGTGKADSG